MLKTFNISSLTHLLIKILSIFWVYSKLLLYKKPQTIVQQVQRILFTAFIQSCGVHKH